MEDEDILPHLRREQTMEDEDIQQTMYLGSSALQSMNHYPRLQFDAVR